MYYYYVDVPLTIPQSDFPAQFNTLTLLTGTDSAVNSSRQVQVLDR